MNIVYYSSDLFSEMCGVAIQSLCENNKDADDINIYVVEDNKKDFFYKETRTERFVSRSKV